MVEFPIYFSDLTEEAQKRLLELLNITSAADGNFDSLPLTYVYYDTEE